MYKFPVIELVDRYCIAKLKFAKLGNNKEELDFYTEQLHDIDFELIQEELDQLYKVHAEVWDLEDDFKKFRVEHIYDLAEVGRRALHVRDVMHQRYDLKNRMADKLNDPVKEMKKYG
jgi:uncharacterized membrane protein YgaE (UPF0421/DUF939 family)